MTSLHRIVGFVAAVFGAILSPAMAQPDVLSVSAEPQATKVHAGDQFAIAVTIDLQDKWHIWPAQGKAEIPNGLSPWWTAIGPVRPESDADKPLPAVVEGAGYKASIAKMQWPAPVVVTAGSDTGKPVKTPAYAGTVVVFIPVIVAESAKPGPATLEWILDFQPCDEHICMGPDTKTFSVSWEVVPNDQPSVFSSSPVFAKFDASVFGDFAGGVTNPTNQPAIGKAQARAEFDFLGYKFSLASNQYAVIFLIAFVAGFLLNLTPCVLPVIPIKVMSLQKQAGNPTKLLLYGSVYCIGIVAMFAVLALLIAVVKQQWGQLFSMPWFSASMGLIVLVLGIGMMGMFTIRLPQAVYMVNPAGDTVQGNFLMGVLTAILSTPCTGPFFGAALAWSATQPTWVGVTTLIVVGAGMAFPYALLIAFPKLIDKMPRSGPGGELLKQVLGILMIAVAAFLFSNLVHGTWMWWVIAGIAAAGFLWAIGGGLRVLRTVKSKAIVSLIAVIGLAASVGLGYIMTRPSGIPWKHFDSPAGGIQTAIDDAHASGKFAVVKFTANWCTNCHVIEHAVYDSPVGVRELNRKDVVAIKVDLSNKSNKEGWELLQKLSGGSGIPFSVFIPPRGDPVSFRSFFKITDLQDALKVKTASLGPTPAHPGH